MKTERGFAPIIILVVILVAALVGGGIFYAGRLTAPKVSAPKNVTSVQSPVPTVPVAKNQFCNSKIGACFNLLKDWIVKETQFGQGAGIPALLINCPENRDGFLKNSELFSIESFGKVEGEDYQAGLDALYKCGTSGDVCALPGDGYINREEKKFGNNNYTIFYPKYYKDNQFSRSFHTYIQNSSWTISAYPDGKNGKFVNCNKDQAEKVLNELLATFTPDETAAWVLYGESYDNVVFKVPPTWVDKPEVLESTKFTKQFEDRKAGLTFTFSRIENLNSTTGKGYASIDEFVGLPYKVKTVIIDGQEGRQPLPRAGSENIIAVDFFSKDLQKIFTLELKVGDTSLNTPQADVEKGQKLFNQILATFMSRE